MSPSIDIVRSLYAAFAAGEIVGGAEVVVLQGGFTSRVTRIERFAGPIDEATNDAVCASMLLSDPC